MKEHDIDDVPSSLLIEPHLEHWRAVGGRLGELTLKQKKPLSYRSLYASSSSVVAVAAAATVTVISGRWCFSAIMSVGLGVDASLMAFFGERGAGGSLVPTGADMVPQ